jgi:hypothetical protein
MKVPFYLLARVTSFVSGNGPLVVVDAALFGLPVKAGLLLIRTKI